MSCLLLQSPEVPLRLFVCLIVCPFACLYAYCGQLFSSLFCYSPTVSSLAHSTFLSAYISLCSSTHAYMMSFHIRVHKGMCVCVGSVGVGECVCVHVCRCVCRCVCV